jgi:uncharacterized protein
MDCAPLAGGLTMATQAADRILSLDVIRGIAVMGIFSVNIVGMAMIEFAYFYPPAQGFESAWDRIMWAGNFLIVDGRFRSLFSILFGASMVLVIERAAAAGKAGWKVHYARMVVLLLFGLAHFYFFWWGDILANYALTGMIAFLFWRLRAKWLLIAGIASLSLMYVPEIVDSVEQLSGPPPTDVPQAGTEIENEDGLTFDELNALDIREDGEAHASLKAHFDYMLDTNPLRPFNSVLRFGFETLGLMLLGMAGYKSGFLTGSWSRKRYLQVAAATLIPAFAFYGFVVAQTLRTNFAEGLYWPWAWGLPTYLHPLAALGYAAVIILVLVRPGAVGDRFAAVGRAAFTNYLGATMIGTLLFYGFGFGLWGELSRAQAWLVVPVTWAVMLLWSKWWLDRFRYGPFEWAWRSLSRWQWEPLRKRSAAPPETA